MEVTVVNEAAYDALNAKVTAEGKGHIHQVLVTRQDVASNTILQKVDACDVIAFEVHILIL